jgi:hypothetical protein
LISTTHATGIVGTSEADRLDELDRLIERYGLARRTYREVWGWVDQPRFLSEPKPRLRIDRIYLPSSKLESAGWKHGPFGVEAKRPGEKIGRAISQSMDYHRTAFEVRQGYHIRLEWVFLWPYEKQHGPLASVLAQQRVGTIETGYQDCLKFAGGEAVGIYAHGKTLEANGFTSGRKRGAR